MKTKELIGIFGSLAAFVTCIASGPLVKLRNARELNQYLDKNLSVVMLSQEQVLGINYRNNVPEVEVNTHLGFQYNGLYNPSSSKISLSVWNHNSAESLNDKLVPFFVFGQAPPVRRTLDHELGHFYTHMVAEENGLPYFLLPYFPPGVNDSKELLAAKKLIREGLAEYFSRKINGGTDDFADHEWSSPLSDWGNRQFYDGGYHLVAPVLDLSVRKGIEFFISNPPSGSLHNLLSYQKRALETVSNEL